MKKRNIDYVGKEVPTEKKTANQTRDIPEDQIQVGESHKDYLERTGRDVDGNQVMVYSKLLQRPFNSLADLKKAENEYREKNALELKEKEERRIAAKGVEDAYKELIDAKKKAAELIDEAEKKYLAKRDEFVNKYKSFHISYTNNNGKENITFGELANKVFDRPKLPFFDDFFDFFNRW